MNNHRFLHGLLTTTAVVLLWGTAVLAQAHPTHFVRHSGRGLGGPIAFSPDARLLASADAYGIQLIDAATLRETAFLPKAKGAARTLLFSPDGRWLAINGLSWDLQKAKAPGSGNTAILNGYFLAINASGKALARAYGKDTSSIELHDLSGGKTKVVLNNRPGWLAAATFSSDGRKLVYARRTATFSLVLWDLVEMRELGEVVGPPSVQVGEMPLEPAAFSPDGNELASVTNSGEIWIWDAAKWNLKKRLRGDCPPFRKVRFSPRGDRVATFCNLTGRGVQVWDLATGSVGLELKGANHYFAFTSNGKQIAWLKGNGPGAVLHFNDTQTGAPVRSLSGLAGAFKFTPQGARIVGELAEGGQYAWSAVLGIWDLQTGARQARIADAGPFAISPDGTIIATQTNLYNSATGERLRRYMMRSGFAHSLSFSPDGRWLAAGWTDNKTNTSAIALWDTRSWTEVAELPGHTADVTQLVFSPDGSQLVSTSYDKTVRVWRLDHLRDSDR